MQICVQCKVLLGGKSSLRADFLLMSRSFYIQKTCFEGRNAQRHNSTHKPNTCSQMTFPLAAPLLSISLLLRSPLPARPGHPLTYKFVCWPKPAPLVQRQAKRQLAITFSPWLLKAGLAIDEQLSNRLETLVEPSCMRLSSLFLRYRLIAPRHYLFVLQMI